MNVICLEKKGKYIFLIYIIFYFLGTEIIMIKGIIVEGILIITDIIPDLKIVKKIGEDKEKRKEKKIEIKIRIKKKIKTNKKKRK